jgi:hypothetical protein
MSWQKNIKEGEEDPFSDKNAIEPTPTDRNSNADIRTSASPPKINLGATINAESEERSRRQSDQKAESRRGRRP